jgi:hypothetical protein
MAEDLPFASPHDCPKCGATAAWTPHKVLYVDWRFDTKASDRQRRYGRLQIVCGRCGFRWYTQTADTPLTPPALTPEQEAEAEITRLIGKAFDQDIEAD